MKTTIHDLLERIEQLETEIARLRAQPKQEYHYHYHQPAQPCVPSYPTLPIYPSPLWPTGPVWISGGVSAQIPITACAQ